MRACEDSAGLECVCCRGCAGETQPPATGLPELPSLSTASLPGMGKAPHSSHLEKQSQQLLSLQSNLQAQGLAQPQALLQQGALFQGMPGMLPFPSLFANSLNPFLGCACPGRA